MAYQFFAAPCHSTLAFGQRFALDLCGSMKLSGWVCPYRASNAGDAWLLVMPWQSRCRSENGFVRRFC